MVRELGVLTKDVPILVPQPASEGGSPPPNIKTAVGFGEEPIEPHKGLVELLENRYRSDPIVSQILRSIKDRSLKYAELAHGLVAIVEGIELAEYLEIANESSQFLQGIRTHVSEHLPGELKGSKKSKPIIIFTDGKVRQVRVESTGERYGIESGLYVGWVGQPHGLTSRLNLETRLDLKSLDRMKESLGTRNLFFRRSVS